jgi:uncharacterized protein (TIGR01777 family)
VRVVVTGGTGFVGRALVSSLVARGDEVAVLTRDPERARNDVPAGVALEAWSAREAWRARVRDCAAVVHLAGEGVADGRWSAARLERIRASRVETTDALAEAIAGAYTKPTWVSASAVGIYGMRRDDDVLDEQGPHGTDLLASICEAWEAATDPARRAGARVAIARLGVVLGRDGGALARMLPAFKAFTGGPLGDGRQWLSWIHRDDAVRGLLFAIDRAEVDGPFNLTAPKPVTMNELAKALGHALHRPSALRVPPFALRLALGEGLAEVLLTGQRAVPARLERAGFTFEYETVDAAMAEIARG